MQQNAKQVKLFMRLIVTAYLLYLARQIGVGMLSGKPGMKPWIGWTAVVVFVAFSVYLAWFSIREYRKAKKDEEEAAQQFDGAADAEQSADVKEAVSGTEQNAIPESAEKTETETEEETKTETETEKEAEK
jgi:cytoskeletal protein RodZ